LTDPHIVAQQKDHQMKLSHAVSASLPVLERIPWQITFLRLVVPAAVLILLAWIIQYTRITHWAAWRDPVGRNLLAMTALMVVFLIPFGGTLFIRYDLMETTIAGLIQIISIAAIVPMVGWRMVVWSRAQRGSYDELDREPEKELAGICEKELVGV
jgi:hypothetical protein